MANVAVRVPPAVGAKFTVIEQVAPIATLLHEFAVMWKSPALAPTIAAAVTLKFVVPQLVIVTFCPPLVAPIPKLPNARLLALTQTAPPGTNPVPWTGTVVTPL